MLNGTKVLAMSIAEVDEPETGEGEEIHLPPEALVVADGKRVSASHLGAFRRVVRLGHRGAFYGVSVTLHGVEPRRSPARRSRFWLLIGWNGGGRWHGVFCRSGWRSGATLEFAGGAWGLAGRRARPAGRYPRGGRRVSVGGTGSGRSGAVNLAGLAWLMWMVCSTFPSS